MHSFHFLRSWFALLLCSALCVFGLASTALAQAPTPTPSLLSSIFNNKGELGIDSVTNTARSQTTATPYYKSNSVETITYDGYFRAASNTTKLALLSDDGSSVWVDGLQILNRAGQGQGFENFDSCFSPLSFSFTAGQTYHITVLYTNTVHLGDADVDGVSLWAYDGGGGMADDFNVQVTQSHATPNPATVGQTVGASLDAVLHSPSSGASPDKPPTWSWEIVSVLYRPDETSPWSTNAPSYSTTISWDPSTGHAQQNYVFNTAGSYQITVKATATFSLNGQTQTRSGQGVIG